MTRAFSLVSALLQLVACATLPVRAGTPLNRQAQPTLKDVRLEGPLAAKTDRLLARRVTDDFMRQTIFDEALRAFVARDDDQRPWDGMWRGEFWGKTMLSAARVAEYLDDPKLKAALVTEGRRLMATADADGYIGSYAVATNCTVSDAQMKAHKNNCTNWNLWNRKYVIWGLLAAYKATGDRPLLDAAVAQARHFIGLVRRLGVPLADTGHPGLYGMPTMSVLKPMLLLYEETREPLFLAFANEIVADWDRADGRAPNFFRNASSGRPLYAWYPQPEMWAKTYEMLSCVDGLIEHARVTGSRRSLETARAVRDNLARHEVNSIGGLGISDRLLGAETFPFASTELCDVIHWIRLNLDLFLETGDDAYMDSIEFSYFNAFLSGIYRSGSWAPIVVRDAGRHRNGWGGQCAYAYHHCCLDNAPRTVMDIASAVVTQEASGRYRVNLYQDATVSLNGTRFVIRGDYPAQGRVTVRVDGPAEVAFRKPGWCPKLDVVRTDEGTSAVYELTFDMNARLVNRSLAASVDTPAGAVATRTWGEDRYIFHVDDDLRGLIPTEPAATVCYGPLVLAKSVRLGASEAELRRSETVNNKGYGVRLTPIRAADVYAPFAVELFKEGAPAVRTKACAYESASDDPVFRGGYIFTTRF